MNKRIKQEQGETIERIRKIREDMGYSQEAFSFWVGISQSTYSKIENNDRPISVENLKKILEKLEVSADYILFGDTVPFDETWSAVVSSTETNKLATLVRLGQYFGGDRAGAYQGEIQAEEEISGFISDILPGYGIIKHNK